MKIRFKCLKDEILICQIIVKDESVACDVRNKTLQ